MRINVKDKRAPFVLGVVLLATWLLLNASFSPGQVLLGVLLTIALLRLVDPLRPVRPRLRRTLQFVPLLGVIAVDVLRSNLSVARVILGFTGGRSVHSGFLDVPLELRDPHALTVLAAILTSTPGTAWAGVSNDGTVLRLHILDLHDEQYWIDTIKQHYEQPLMRIFEQ